MLITRSLTSTSNRAIASAALYATGAIGVCAVLVELARSYTPFDASGLVFVHYRLAGAPAANAAFTLAAVCWFIGFAGIFLCLHRAGTVVSRCNVALLVAAQAVLGAVFAALPIAIDSDQYAYVGYAYAADRENPYVRASLPAGAPQPVARVFRHWGNPLPDDAYGGAWTLGNAALLRYAAGAPAPIQAVILRVAALIAACAVTVLLAEIPRMTFSALALVALNPLVLLETANGAHNDVFLVLFGVAALALVLRGRALLAGMALGLSATVKFAYAPLLLVLATGAWAIEGRRSAALWACVGFAGVVLAASAPFGLLRSAVRVPAEHVGSEGGLLDLAAHALQHIPIMRAHAALGVSALVVTAFAITVITLALDARAKRVSAPVAIVAAALLVALPGKIEPWYALMMIPLVAAPSMATRIAFAGFSAFGMWLVRSDFTGEFPVLSASIVGIFFALVLYALLRPQGALGFGRRRWRRG